MSKWSQDNIKKSGLSRFTRNKFEYAIGKSMNMEVKDAVDMFMDIAENYATQKIRRLIKASKQTGIFEVNNTTKAEAPAKPQADGGGE